MRKVLIISLLFIFVMGLYAAESDDTAMFAKTMAILKVLTHDLGYKVLFYKTDLSLGVFYLPYSWFSTSGGKGAIVWGNDKSYPYFTIFWKDGEFNHIKLFLQDNMAHRSWGSLNKSISDVKAEFGVTPETFNINFGTKKSSPTPKEPPEPAADSE